MVAGRDAVREGEAKNSWLTGTAAWNYVAIAHHMLGIRPELDGLRVSPCIGAEIPSFTITRRCRGATYVIRVTNSLGESGPKLVVDGEAIEGTLVPYAAAGATVEIECET
jgi:cellobiose phosphorylase